MSVVVDFELPAESFELGRILEIRPDIKIRVESMIPTGESIMPYVWVATEDADDVAASLEAEELVADVRRIDDADGETLFRVEWAAGIDGFVGTLARSEATVLAAEGTGDDWNFQLRFPDYDALSAFYRTCRGDGIPLDLGRIGNPVGDGPTGTASLTRQQREAIETALEAGYFEVPRQVTLVELSERLGISDSALSQRLRRGLATLVSRTLLEEGRDGATSAGEG